MSSSPPGGGAQPGGAQPSITMYRTAWCPYCQRAQQLLKAKGLEVAEIDVEEDASKRAEMISRSGRRTVPQIFIGDRHVGGCDDLVALADSGELDRIIQGES
jgi:glutaredoxin 3